MQAVDGGKPLTANPHHFAGSSLDSDTQEDYKALPGKLGFAAAPIVSSMVSATDKLYIQVLMNMLLL